MSPCVHCFPDADSGADISEDLRLALVDAYACEKTPTDGEFYTKIRQYERTGNQAFKEDWLSQLAAVSPQKSKNLKRLLQLTDYVSALDCQLDMPGLSKSMKLGTIHSMLAMRCNKVCAPRSKICSRAYNIRRTYAISITSRIPGHLSCPTMLEPCRNWTAKLFQRWNSQPLDSVPGRKTTCTAS